MRENIIELIASSGARLENEVAMYLNSEISKIDVYKRQTRTHAARDLQYFAMLFTLSMQENLRMRKHST